MYDYDRQRKDDEWVAMLLHGCNNRQRKDDEWVAISFSIHLQVLSKVERRVLLVAVGQPNKYLSSKIHKLCSIRRRRQYRDLLCLTRGSNVSCY